MSLDTRDEAFVASAWRSLGLKALDPSKPEDRERYYSIYEREDLRDLDPVATLYETITWTEHGSASLFSGYRGTGKSTELLRLKRRLEEERGAVVLYCDMHDYVNLDAPPDVPDFLLATAGAFADQVERDAALKQALDKTFWPRLVDFLKSVRVQVDDVSITGEPGGVGVGLKLALKSSPTFQKRLQEQLSSVVGALAREVREYYRLVVAGLRQLHGDDVPIVVLFDSLEHIKGTSRSAADVAAHLVSTFNRSDHLRVPGVHLVFTVPPWLKVQAPEVVAAYDTSVLLPCVKVCERQSRDRFQEGLDAMKEVVTRRFEWEGVVDRQQLDRLSACSGGQFRDLFRLLQAVLRSCSRHGTLPATPEIVDWAINDVRNGYLPVPHADASWIRRIDQTGEAWLEELSDLSELARFFDSHLVLTYRNGTEWYRAHPLIADEVRRIASLSDSADEG